MPAGAFREPKDIPETVAEAAGAATVADDFELTVDLASGATREEVLLALDTIKARILESDWPPA